MIKYIVKYVNEDMYYGGDNYGWFDREGIAEAFENKEDAMTFLNGEPDGWYAIEEIYIVKS